MPFANTVKVAVKVDTSVTENQTLAGCLDPVNLQVFKRLEQWEFNRVISLPAGLVDDADCDKDIITIGACHEP